MACGSACGCAQPKHCLLKRLKPKRLLILQHVANNDTMSESSVLKQISDDFGIPLSTLKLNIKMLFEHGLVERKCTGDPIVITSTGKSALVHLDRLTMR
jgi:predicted transcriptional regulator